MERIDLGQSSQYHHHHHHLNIPLHNHPSHQNNDSLNINHHHKQSHLHRPLSYRHPPIFIAFISILQVVAFVYYALRTENKITFVEPIPFDSKLIYNPYRRYEFWRYITYMFIHAGYWHIIFNVLIQLAVGIPLETVHNFNSIFIIYMGGVLSGALGNSIVDPASFLAGASSGCYALITAHFSNIIINWKELKKPYIKLLTLLLLISFDFGIAIYERYFGRYGHWTYRISYAGHLSGGISGLLLGFIFLKNFKVHHWEEALAHYSTATYVILTLMATTFNVLNKDYFPQPDYKSLDWTLSPFRLDRE